MTLIRFRPSIEEQVALERKAATYGMTVEDYAGMALACHALDRTLPRPTPIPRPKETQSEKRARLRAESPDGMSPYTREIQTIRPTEEPTRA